MKSYEKGDTFKETGDMFKSYTISENIDGIIHYSKIVIYEDKKLRNKILKLLNEQVQA